MPFFYVSAHFEVDEALHLHVKYEENEIRTETE